MHGFHGPGVTEHEVDVLVAATVGEPVPAVHALAGDQQAVAERSDGPQERLGGGRQIAGQARLPFAVEDHQEHVPGVQIDTGIELRRGGRREGTHEDLLELAEDAANCYASMIVQESLHEYPTDEADRGRHTISAQAKFLQATPAAYPFRSPA